MLSAGHLEYETVNSGFARNNDVNPHFRLKILLTQ